MSARLVKAVESKLTDAFAYAFPPPVIRQLAEFSVKALLDPDVRHDLLVLIDTDPTCVICGRRAEAVTA